MSIVFAERVKAGEGANRVYAALAAELEAQGIPVINCSQGTATFQPHTDAVVALVRDSMNTATRTRYSPTLGEMGLREKEAKYLTHLISHGGTLEMPQFTAEDVGFVGSGSAAVFCALATVAEPGKRVLTPKGSSYSNYPAPIKFTGATQDFYDFNADGVSTYDQLKKAVDPDKAGTTNVASIIIPRPDNPSGRTFTEKQAKEQAKALERLIKKYPGVQILLDSAYLDFADVGHDHTPYPFLSDTAKQNCVLVFSGTKTRGFGNLRVASFASPNTNIVRNIQIISSGITMGANTIGAAALVELADLFTAGSTEGDGYEWGIGDGARMQANHHYMSRLRTLHSGFTNVAEDLGVKLEVEPPHGSMFLWVKNTGLIGKPIPERLQPYVGNKTTIETDGDIVKMLMSMHKVGFAPVACIPGVGFSAKPEDGYIRFAGIESPELLEQASVTFRAMHEMVIGREVSVQGNIEKVREIQAREKAALAQEQDAVDVDVMHAITSDRAARDGSPNFIKEPIGRLQTQIEDYELKDGKWAKRVPTPVAEANRIVAAGYFESAYDQRALASDPRRERRLARGIGIKPDPGETPSR